MSSYDKKHNQEILREAHSYVSLQLTEENLCTHFGSVPNQTALLLNDLSLQSIIVNRRQNAINLYQLEVSGKSAKMATNGIRTHTHTNQRCTLKLKLQQSFNTGCL